MSTESIPAELETDRLLLRRWTAADADEFADMNADPAVMQHIGEPLTREQSDAFLTRIQRQFDDVGYGLWAVEVRETGDLAGFTGLAILGHAAPTTEAVEVGLAVARARPGGTVTPPRRRPRLSTWPSGPWPWTRSSRSRRGTTCVPRQ